MPTLLLWAIMFRALITMMYGYFKAIQVMTEQEEQYYARRRRERRREEELMIAFYASMAALDEPYVFGNVPFETSELDQAGALGLARLSGLSI
jgi:hypothetical protein